MTTDQPNVVIIVIDTLRNGTIDFNRLRLGDPEIFNDFTVYGNCVSPASWTLSSHASIFTGKYASEHTIHEDKEKRISTIMPDAVTELKFKTIFQLLKKRGYMNYGISRNPILRPGTIFERGFDVLQYFEFPFLVNNDYSNLYEKILNEFELPVYAFGFSAKKTIAVGMIKERRMRELMDFYLSRRKANKLFKIQGFPLEKGATHILEILKHSSLLKPFSLFLNIMEMHEPYPTAFSLYDSYKQLISQERMKTGKVQEIRREYIAQGKRVRNFLRAFLSNLKAMGEWDNTLVIITSDHGQSLWEHGFGGHGSFLYNELVRVPLLVKYPNNHSGGIANMLCSTVDIFGLIDNFSSGDLFEIQPSDVVFSESFGLINQFKQILFSKSNDERERLEVALRSIDFRNISAFKGNVKITLNAEDGKITEYLENSKAVEINRARIVETGILDDIEIFDGKIVLPFR